MAAAKKGLAPEVKALVDRAKKDGHVVFSLKLAGVPYIYRSINREEFRELQQKLADEAEEARVEAVNKKQGLAEDDPKVAEVDAQLEKKAMEIREKGEERLVEKGLLHPQLSLNTPAGVSTSIADRIMEASAFGSEEEPEML